MIKPMQIRSWNDLLFLIARQTDRERSGFPSLVEATIIHGSSQEILYTGGRGRLREHGRIGKSMPAVLASRSSSLPREEATNAGLNARHESNLPRQLLDICGLHSARNLRDLSTNSSNADDPNSSSLSLSLFSTFADHVRADYTASTSSTRFTCKQKAPLGEEPILEIGGTLIVHPNIFERIDLISKRIGRFDFEEQIKLFSFERDRYRKFKCYSREIDRICSRNLDYLQKKIRLRGLSLRKLENN